MIIMSMRLCMDRVIYSQLALGKFEPRALVFP